MSHISTPKSINSGLNYAKLRNKKKNSQSQQQEQKTDISPIKGNVNEHYAIFDNIDMDRDNLDYISSLLQNQQPKTRDVSRHKRTKSQISRDIGAEKEQNPKFQSLTPNHSGKFKKAFDFEEPQSKTPRPHVQSQKLFDDFFQQEQALQSQNQQSSHNTTSQGPKDAKFYTLSDTDPSHHSTQDFISVIDTYISYLNSQPDHTLLLTPKTQTKQSQQGQLPQQLLNQKSHFQESQHIKALEKALYQQDKKIKELSFNQKLLYNEVKQFQQNEKQQISLISMQKQEIKMLKKQLKNAQIKSDKYKQSYKDEKSQRESCQYLLEKVQQKMFQQGSIQSIQKMVNPTKSVQKSEESKYQYLYGNSKQPQFFDADDIEAGSFCESEQKNMDESQQQHLYSAIQQMIMNQNQQGNFVGNIYNKQFGEGEDDEDEEESN